MKEKQRNEENGRQRGLKNQKSEKVRNKALFDIDASKEEGSLWPESELVR